ncbi:cytochrome P450 2C19-like [Eublepharis macularius]|uniref:Cytochrome P450 2C19-like n=1 Tax=Eublepharis macularius TaxID=481883 RepID=A0AA97L962_EUBMA|nr:cytochrome P450 2C19-like [Eublepharis macularius]
MDLLGTTAFLLISLCCLFLLAAWRKGTQRKNLPPGPTPLPIIGNLLQLKATNIAASLKKMSEKYGPVFTVYFGSDQAVILYGYDVVKEVLVDRGEEFTYRGSVPSADKTNRGLGVLMSNGKRWVELRRFSITTLRNFGMGKKSTEEHIQEEAEHLMKELQAKKGQPFNPALLFSCATGNVISRILLGERFDYQDPKYLQILRFLIQAFRLESSVNGQLYNFFPRIMDYLPGPHQTFFKSLSSIQEFISQKIKEHEKSLDINAPRDFIDSFLIKMEQEKHNSKTEFTRENLMMTGYDIFIAGTETTSTTLRSILMILVEHPAVQAKIHKEIDQVIGRERAPSMKDRTGMPYTEAAIHEAQRFMDLIPLGFTRMVKQDFEIRGFTIPKGATLYPILSSALHDPKQYKNPYQFDPEHFLDERGAFKKNGADIPFSAGKRNCLGEGLARMQLFLYVTTILQSFWLKRPPGVTKIDLTPEVSGLGNIPHQIPFCFSPR